MPVVGRRPLLLAVTSLSLLAACSDAGPSSFHAARDSAGIRIVETHGFAWDSGGGWTVSDEPLVQIGSRDGDEELQFFEVSGGLRLTDGGIVLLNGGSRSIRVFTGEGRFLAEFGGAGDGPGEFRTLGSVHRISGDTLLIWDGRRSGYSVFTSSGTLVGDQRLAPPGSEQISSFHPLSDGRLAVMTSANVLTHGQSRGIGIHRDPSPVLIFSRDGTLLDTLSSVRSHEFMVLEHGLGFPPFGKATQFEVVGETALIGTAEALEILVLDLTGEPTAIFRYPGMDLTLSREDRDWFVDRAREGATPQEREILPMLLAELIFPDTRAAYSDMKIDDAGAVWLRTGRHFPPYAPSREWTVLSRDGVFLGTVILPERFEPLEFGAESVMGVWTDEMDVEFIRIHRIEKGS